MHFGFLLALPLLASSVRIIQTNSAGDDVSIIDPATNKVVGTIHGIEVNHGAASAPDGSRYYISNEAESTLDVVDTQNNTLIGNQGNDTLRGGAGINSLDGGPGRDVAVYNFASIPNTPFLVGGPVYMLTGIVDQERLDVRPGRARSLRTSDSPAVAPVTPLGGGQPSARSSNGRGSTAAPPSPSPTGAAAIASGPTVRGELAQFPS
jgi:Ca2+-binding RTX toxin-like protein